MSVASKNPFALLDEDGLNPPAPEPALPTTDTTTTNQPPARGGQRGGRGRGGPGSRGGKYYLRGGATRPSGPREGAEEEGADDSAGKKVESTDGGRGRGRGRGRGDNRGDNRGDRRGDKDGFRAPRREHDRRSATGKTDSDKKIHQSWGGDEGQTELATETAAADDVAAEQAAPAESGDGGDWGAGGGNTEWGATGGGGDTEWGATGRGGDTEWDATGGGGDTEWGATGGGGDTEWGAAAPASTTNAEEPAERSERRPRDRQEEETDNTLTLDQYLAQKKEKSSLIPQLETRKVEQDEGLWKGAKELVKGADEDVYVVGKSKAAPKTRAKKEGKVFLEIEARFERPNTRGRGRGGERGGGGDRGGRVSTRGQRRGSRQNGDSTLNVGDETAFPSLS